MKIDLEAVLQRVQATAAKDPSEAPVVVLTLDATADSSQIGQLARFLGKSVNVRIESLQLSFDDVAPKRGDLESVTISDTRGHSVTLGKQDG